MSKVVPAFSDLSSFSLGIRQLAFWHTSANEKSPGVISCFYEMDALMKRWMSLPARSVVFLFMCKQCQFEDHRNKHLQQSRSILEQKSFSLRTLAEREIIIL